MSVMIFTSIRISIHALCEEGDLAGQVVLLDQVGFLSTPSARRATWIRTASWVCRSISIHALCEEGDSTAPRLKTPLLHFYPRPLRGGRPTTVRCLACSTYFYPRPLRGGRQSWSAASEAIFKFLSTPSARRATDAGKATIMANLFLSTPSARRATAKTETKSLFSNKLYNILHEFRRALIYNGSKSYPNHAK